MAIIRAPRPTKNFAQISNAMFEDKRLTWKAKGILGYLLSRPVGWRTDAESLAKEGIGGRDLVRGALKELERYGYLTRRRTNDPQTGRWSHDQYVTDAPVDQEPPAENPPPAPTSENSASPQVSPSGGFPDAGEPADITRRTTQEGEKEENDAAAPADARTEEGRSRDRRHPEQLVSVGRDYEVTPEELTELRTAILHAAPSINANDANRFWLWLLDSREPVHLPEYVRALHERGHLATMIRRWRKM